MLISSRFIESFEYKSNEISKTDHVKAITITTKPKKLRVNAVRLAAAVAKTMHSNKIHPIEFFFATGEQISALQRHTASFSTNNNNLRLRDTYFYKNRGLRDFSKTTIEGQYAQGINFLFFQDILGQPAIIDFDKYCRDEGIAELPSGSSRPDFIGYKNGSYWILESKANLESNSVKPELRDGLLQCDAGKTHLTNNGLAAPARSYCALVSFHLESSQKDTIIHYCDPTSPRNNREFDAIKFLKRYYETTLSALGYRNPPEEIWLPNWHPRRNAQFEHNGMNYLKINGGNNFDRLFRFSSWRPRAIGHVGISTDILDAIRNENLDYYNKLTRIFQEQIETPDINNDVYFDEPESELFVDGTLVTEITY